jgi:hypothetical protein
MDFTIPLDNFSGIFAFTGYKDCASAGLQFEFRNK